MSPAGASVWAVANQKGGVAKTTTAVALAGLLAQWELRVLLVDLDPHASLTSYCGIDPECVSASAYDLFQPGAAAPDPVPAWPGIDLVAAAPSLATLDRRQHGEGMGLVMQRWLQPLRRRYDHIFMDCAPMLGLLMVNALVACDHVLVPAQTEFLSLNGVRRMQRTLEMIAHSRHSELSWLIVPTMFDRRTRASLQSLRLMREEFGHRVWGGVIPVDTRLRDASKAGLPPSEFAPRARSVRAYGELLAFLSGQAATHPREEATA